MVRQAHHERGVSAPTAAISTNGEDPYLRKIPYQREKSVRPELVEGPKVASYGVAGWAGTKVRRGQKGPEPGGGADERSVCGVGKWLRGLFFRLRILETAQPGVDQLFGALQVFVRDVGGLLYRPAAPFLDCLLDQ